MQIQKSHVRVPDCCTSFKMEHKKRMRYDASFKLKVVEMAKGTNNCKAARQYGINEKQVREWRKSEAFLQKLTRKKCALRGKNCKWPELERDLC